MRFFIVIFLSLCMFSLQGEIVKRAALDIGSGETKLTVADVDTSTHKVVKVHYQGYKYVELRNDLAESLDGCLSERVENKLIETLLDFKETMTMYAPEQWSGFGTAALRKALNGKEFLERVHQATGISIHIVPQEEEGRIGFLSAVAASGLEPDQVIAWDSGSGSFQMTSENDMYGVEFAFVPAWEVLVKEIRGEKFNQDVTPNPVSLDESQLLTQKIQDEKLTPAPRWLLETNKKIVTIGADRSIFRMGQIATGKTQFTRSELLEAIKAHAGKTDEQLFLFAEPHKVLVGLSLLHAVMNHCGFENMEFARVNGGCEGLMMLEEYWE